MAGVEVANGDLIKEKKITKPEPCKKCQRRQCDLTCLSFDKYIMWRQYQRRKC